MAPGAKESTPLNQTMAVTTYKGGCEGLETVVDYDLQRTATTADLFTFKGTVLSNSILWIEQCIIVAVFGLVGTGAYFYGRAVSEELTESKSSLSSFTSIMSGLAAFLLGFYTSLSVGRWWRLRTSGVGNIWSSCSQLSLLISQMATRDEKILSAVRRYARASLMVIFLKRRHGAQELKSRLGSLSDWGVLTEDEVEQLRSYNNNLAESIWTWNVNIVTQLYQQGLIKTEWQYTYILERAMLGRSGAALIGAQMGTPIPFQYVHLLSFLVKLHNLMLALVFGAFFGYDLGSGTMNVVEAVQVIGRVMLVPFLYNSLLIINETLADPFGSMSMNDFPMTKYEKGIESDGASYVEAGANLPDLLTSKRKLEGV